MSGHSHPHPHGPAEAHNASAGRGPVLVDVDEEHGALVLLAPPALEGAEIEVSPRMPDGSPGPRTHVAVLARPLGADRVHAAVYPSLRAGRWLVHDPDADRVALAVDVPGGRVTQVGWPDPEPSAP
jgi:phosphomannomutase